MQFYISIKKGIWDNIVYNGEIIAAKKNMYKLLKVEKLKAGKDVLEIYNYTLKENFIGSIKQLYYALSSAKKLPVINYGYEDTETFHIEYFINTNTNILETLQEIYEKNANYKIYKLPKDSIVEQIYYIVPKI
jgi:hypothetical protein